jgi:hypothetical protein
MASSIFNENPGHDLDPVTLFSSMNHDAETEALALHSLLESNGIDSTLVGPNVIPTGEFQVQVPRAQLEDARRVMSEAREAGPAAAEEAEAAGEAGSPAQ